MASHSLRTIALLPEALREVRLANKQIQPDSFYTVYESLLTLERTYPLQAADSGSADAAGPVIEAVKKACRMLLKQEYCLPKALAAYRMLRRRGVPVDFSIGIQPFPFVAHAWLELGDTILDEQEGAIPTKYRVALHTRQIREQLS